MTPYADVSDGDTYFESKLNTLPWDSATTTNKLKAQKNATLLIEALNFHGEKQSLTQENHFPRKNDTVVPVAIQNANCELALALLDGVDIDLERENLGMTSMGFGSAKSTYDRSRVPEHIVSGIPSFQAWRFLKPYLRDPKRLRIRRTS